MDQEAYDHCKADDRYQALRPDTFEDFSKMGMHRRLRYFWIRRFDVLQDFLNRGQSFIHTDLDAFWHRDITPIIDAIDADIVISREFGMPKPAVNAWGFALCCGLFAVRPSSGSKALFAAWRKELPKTYHDQVALNMMLLKADIQWKDVLTEEDQEKHETTREHIHSVGHLRLGENDVRIVVLNDTTVARIAPTGNPSQLPHVSHPFFERKCQQSYFSMYSAFETCGLPNFNDTERTKALAHLDLQALKFREVQDYLGLCWAIAHAGANADWLGHRALLSHKAGAQVEACRDLEQALELDPGNIKSALALYDVYRALGDTQGQSNIATRLSRQKHVGKLQQREIAARLITANRPFAALPFALRAVSLAITERMAYWRELWFRN